MTVFKSTIKTLLLETNYLTDKDEDITIDSAIGAIENHETVQFLDQEFDDHVGLSLVTEGDHIDIDEVNELIFQHWGSFGNENRLRKKSGIENNGLNLIQAVLIEIISGCENLQE